jgi:PAS domain S-box-containing protein
MLTPLPALDSRVDQLLCEHIRDIQAPSPEEVRRLVYEIERRESQLEQQNEELRKIQQHIEAYKDRYVDLYDFAPLGYATLDGDGYLQEINLAGAKMLGAERAALTGYPFGEYVAKDDQNVFLDHVRECVRERREVTSELRLVAAGGQSITVQMRSIPIEGPQDDTLCKTAITDITERKDMEEALRQSRTFLQTVVDAIPDTMLVVGRDYRVLLANCAAREMVGGIDPTVCLTCHHLSHHDDHPCEGPSAPCQLCQVIATKARTTVIHTHCDAKGKEVFVEVNAAPVFDDAGDVVHVIEVCRDITERRQAKNALEQERNLLRTLIDNLPDCIYVKDAQSRFIAANLTTARIMGTVTPNDLLGKTDGDFYPQELAAEYRADEEELLRSGQPLVNKSESRRDPTGDPRTVLTTKIPLKDSRGQVFGLVGISRDITEHKHAEEALRLVQLQLLEQQRREREQVEADPVKVTDQLMPEK